MTKKIASVIMLIVGIISGVLFLLFGNNVPMYLKIILKIIPTFLMCCWILMMKIDKTNWPIFVGIIFSMLGDAVMALNGQTYMGIGIIINMLGLIFYIVYFIKTDGSLDILRFTPGAIVIGVLYFILYDYLTTFKLPVLVYCLIYVIFIWRATARLGDKTISKLSQYVCFIGSLILTVSDCMLSMLLFNVLPYKNKYYSMVMFLWWSGLLLLMLTAEIKRQRMRQLSK